MQSKLIIYKNIKTLTGQ